MTPTRSLAGLAVASAVLLSGCGSVPDFNPGVAARVGDETISLSAVDDVAESYCGAIEPQLEKESQVFPNSLVLGNVAGNLTLRAAADQLADEYGVEADKQYDRAVDQVEGSLTDLSADQRDAIIEVDGTRVYVNAVQLSVGRAILREEGGSGGGDEAALAAGQEALQAWLDDNDVRLDPRYGLEIDQGQVVPADTSVSFPLGDIAKGATGQPDPVVTAGLPETQRCG